MSTSPSDSIEIKDSDSESSRSSPVQLPQQSSPMVTRSKGRASARMPTPPQPPSSRTRKKSWMVNSTKMNTRSSQGKAKITSPVTSPGTIPVTNSVTSPVDDAPTASSGDVEVREPVAGPSQVHLPPNSNYTKARDASMASNQSLAHSIRGEMFTEVFQQALSCREGLKSRFQKFLRFMDPKASHCGHLVEPPTFEVKVPEFVQRLSFGYLATFLNASLLRTYWEIVRDLQETELVVFQTLGRIDTVLKGNPPLDKDSAKSIMGHFATIATTNDAFCTRMAARITLTPEQRIFFDENDIANGQLLCFRLVMTADLPSVEDRLRLLWSVAPVYPARMRFLEWNDALSRSNRALETGLETLTAAIDDVESEARGTKRKADEEIQSEQ